MMIWIFTLYRMGSNGLSSRWNERMNDLDTMDDYVFFRRFRLTKHTVENMLEGIEDALVYNNQK